MTLLPPPPALLIASVSTFCDWFHENHCNRSTCINHFLQQCFFISKLRIRIKKIYEFRFRPSIVSHKPLTRARYRYNPHNWAISIDGFNPSSNNFQFSLNSRSYIAEETQYLAKYSNTLGNENLVLLLTKKVAQISPS